MTAGRPRSFTDPNTLMKKLNEYFTDKEIDTGAWQDVPVGETVVPMFRPTMAGICVHLGICKDTWSEYGRGTYDTETEKYSDLIKQARLAVESVVERRALYENAGAGPIFWLKNHAGYVDKTEVESTGLIEVKTIELIELQHERDGTDSAA